MQFNFIIPQVAWGLIAATTSTSSVGSGNGKRRKRRRSAAAAVEGEDGDLVEGLNRDELFHQRFLHVYLRHFAHFGFELEPELPNA